MKELIVKPSFLSKITVNNEYLEKQKSIAIQDSQVINW